MKILPPCDQNCSGEPKNIQLSQSNIRIWFLTQALLNDHVPSNKRRVHETKFKHSIWLKYLPREACLSKTRARFRFTIWVCRRSSKSKSSRYYILSQRWRRRRHILVCLCHQNELVNSMNRIPADVPYWVIAFFTNEAEKELKLRSRA